MDRYSPTPKPVAVTISRLLLYDYCCTAVVSRSWLAAVRVEVVVLIVVVSLFLLVCCSTQVRRFVAVAIALLVLLLRSLKYLLPWHPVYDTAVVLVLLIVACNGGGVGAV